ncbi:zona pellucida sperm-binding protein 1-like isoform X2 [Dicentrarchus labrax]|uniref:zona pellucida sperm-binding protein 1-like isoform X2 n=1 Tax=Dicentrarchus labrax TaxID=13489 RepID=UPI0021F55A38|nr:zona pellucida sperm-binding protein 1-like isoform X2 [Dicentrarchus labrax]
MWQHTEGAHLVTLQVKLLLTMAKCWSAASLVALALLGCFVGTEVGAQESSWQKPVPQVSPPYPQYPQTPQVLPPTPPKVPQYPQTPQVRPPTPPKVPQYPQPPQVRPPTPPKVPQYPQPPQVRPPTPPKGPQYPQPPQVRPPTPPKVPQYPQPPQVLPPTPPKVPQYPATPQVSPPYPQYPQTPQVSPPYPQYDPTPQVSPPYPQYPKTPPVQPPTSPKVPQYPKMPPVQPPSPPKVPQYPQTPQVSPPYPQYPKTPPVQPPTSPKVPQYPKTPPVQPPTPPKVPQYPQTPQVSPPYPQYPKTPQVSPPYPQYPKTPPVQPPSPPKVPLYPKQPQIKIPPRPQVPQHRKSPKFPAYPRGLYSPQEPQQPQHPQEPQQPQTSEPKQPSYQSCEVTAGQRVPCGGSGISAAACEAIGCCFDGRQCYFGKAVTVQCTKDAQFIVVVAKDATLPNIDLESISLLGQGYGCTHIDSNSEFAIYQFPVTACGSVVMEEPGVIIYENRITSTFEIDAGPLGVITRDSHYDLLFQCRYIGTSVETLVVEVLPLDNPPLPVAALGPIRVHLRLANGQCSTKGCNEVDVAYTSYYTDTDYPVTKILRDPVYVEVQLLEKTDPLLVLTLGRCWTTTSPNPHSLPQWDILIDGCPYRDDRYLSAVVPVDYSSPLLEFPSHYSRFIFKMFTFVDPNSMEPLREQVYIHCSTSVCAAAPGRNCGPSCQRQKRDVEAVNQETSGPKVVASVGPVVMVAPEQ